ncbi:NUDIX hydrolase domain-like protein [Ophiocordyceps camponoti-floridani]|uniref:NUDIX hydrolase domain-like protein n=1 Tax=Ophiocordyceps camponoti-floridani TaxID=2030778 RepID=A0A8H4Q824_9HYPO|nr:NUDIX hydrolase domain-like protein [Ophiocordyceps camponoti-floridani]
MDINTFREEWARVHCEYNERVETLSRRKNELITSISQLSHQLSELNRLASTSERQRSAILFRRPVSHRGRFNLGCLGEDMAVMVSRTQDLTRSKEAAEAELRDVEAQLTAARVRFARELSRLRQ